MTNEYDIVVIGGGPAGLTAGIYAARAGRSVLIVERLVAGGQAAQVREIENYTGFETVSGFELGEKMAQHAKSAGAEIVFDEMTNFVKDGKTFNISLRYGGGIKCTAIILCMGAVPKRLNIKGEEEHVGMGVSYCATCDGMFFKNKNVVVVGGGTTAVEDSLYLAQIAKNVVLVHSGARLKADSVLLNKLASANVKVLTAHKVIEISGNMVENVTLQNLVTNETTSVDASGVFIAAGKTPMTAILSGLSLDENGYIITNEEMGCEIEGVFAAGDIRHKVLRQVVTACADGAIAGESAAKYCIK